MKITWLIINILFLMFIHTAYAQFGTGEYGDITVGNRTPASGHILVADGSDFQSVAVSGDVTVGSTGIVTIANNSVDGTDIAVGSDAQGDVLYYDGTNWARLAVGTSGHFLKTQGAGANPIWAAAGSGSGLIRGKDEGTSQGLFDTINAVGDNVSLSVSGTLATLTISGTTSAVADKISELDTKVETVDAGDGYIVFDEDGTEVARITGGNLNVPDVAYSADWNGSAATVSRNSIYDLIQLINEPFSVYASGTAATVTGTMEILSFGTTSPTLSLTMDGVYYINAAVQLKYDAATFSSNQTATCKLSRSNNTPADLTHASRTVDLAVITTVTDNAGAVIIPAIYYTTANNDDEIEIDCGLSGNPSAGSIKAVSAEITATRVTSLIGGGS